MISCCTEADGVASSAEVAREERSAAPLAAPRFRRRLS